MEARRPFIREARCGAERGRGRGAPGTVPSARGARVYRRRGPRLALAALALGLAPSCQSFNVFTLQDDAELGEQAYAQVLAENELVTSGPSHQMVNRAMEKLVQAARSEDPDIVDAFTWEVNLIADDATVNAFALPGGKMAVYTGILPVAGSEEGLAVVMGHEIGHVLERHGTEAMTKQYTAAVIIDALALGDTALLAEIGNSLLQLQFGRTAELEADRRGLMMMARAGYDPRAAVDFWTRMSQLGESGTPEWLSTHPTHENRIGQIQSLLPEALSIYEANRATPGGE